MFEDINRQLSEIKEKLRLKLKLEGMLEAAKDSMEREQRKLEELRHELEKEDSDVKRFESLSLTALFHAILGDKERKIDEEREEQLAARLKYDACVSGIKALEQEISETSQSLRQYGNLDMAYETLMKTKEELILDAKDEYAGELVALMEKTSDLQSGIKELREASDAGNKAQNALSNVVESLESAKNWGTWDMFGGGLLATAAKHSRIDEARDYANNAQYLLGRFQRELGDVNLSTDISIDIGSFDTFADYFFDGLIFDWSVQSKINTSLDHAAVVLDRVRTITADLNRRLDDKQDEMNKAKEEMKQMVENA